METSGDQTSVASPDNNGVPDFVFLSLSDLALRLDHTVSAKTSGQATFLRVSVALTREIGAVDRCGHDVFAMILEWIIGCPRGKKCKRFNPAFCK